MRDINACREAYPNHYVKVVAYDRSQGRQTSALSFIVNRPEEEPGFRLERQETHDRMIRYTIHSYARAQHAGRRALRRRGRRARAGHQRVQGQAERKTRQSDD